MRSALAQVANKRAERRQRAASLSAVPPAETSGDYSTTLATVAASILYRSPIPSQAGRPVYILNAAAFPDAFDVDYDTLLSYVLARLPGEDELLSGTEYEIIFFAGGQPDSVSSEKKQGPGVGWYLQAYHVLSRATRKRLQRMYIVHPRTWVRVLVGVFGTIVSPKFRRKIVHLNTLTALALQLPLEKLLIPPAVYLHDRKISPDIYVPYVTGKRAFGVRHPLPKNINTGHTRLPRVLRETTSFMLSSTNVRREGLFRIPGNATLTSVLKEAYDRGQDFIVWKEQGTLVVQPGIDQSLLDEIRSEDAYGIHLAASLIKQWYRDLREPIFPESTYTSLRERYLDPDTPVTPEDLVEIILLQSEISPLTRTAREILTRHLLPLLSAIAEHEAENKMNPANLSILFSMCLICGSDQLEDAKIATIVKRLLQAALESWPQLRDGMGIPEAAFYADLQAPVDTREYEDPLEEDRPPPQRNSLYKDRVDDANDDDFHRIVLEDSETSPVKQSMPKLALRVLDRSIPGRAPALPPRAMAAPISSTTASLAGSGSDPAASMPKRKPAPPITEPPRYSSVFDSDGASLGTASPASYAPADGFGPPRHGPWSFDESDKKGYDGNVPQHIPEYAVMVPKRKALSADDNTDGEVATKDAGTDRRGSDGTLLARMAAEKAAMRMTQRHSTDPTSSSASTPTEALEGVLTEGDGMFRKPTWPASARPQTLAKPFQPLRQAQTFPMATNGNYLSASNVPRPRAPSPGLLKRMSSMESVNDVNSTSSRSALEEPRRLDLKRPSVDDLKRLYEERLNTARGLARVDAARRASTSY